MKLATEHRPPGLGVPSASITSAQAAWWECAQHRIFLGMDHGMGSEHHHLRDSEALSCLRCAP